jgi:2OG-Fe(II) oxygenase superfamily
MIEIEKFIPSSYADILEDIVCKSPEFQWVYTPSTNNEKETKILKKNASSYESDQLVHAIYLENARRSQFFDAVFPFFYFLEEKTGIKMGAIERIKANMLLKSAMPDDKYNTPHIDVPDAGYKSLIYYVKDSDGDTFVFNETFRDQKALTLDKRIAPKKGKAVIFDSDTWHASSNPRQNQNRVVLNLIFRVKP